MLIKSYNPIWVSSYSQLAMESTKVPKFEGSENKITEKINRKVVL